VEGSNSPAAGEKSTSRSSTRSTQLAAIRRQ